MSTMPSFSSFSAASHPVEQPIHDYVAQLQLHMALQARHLIPGFDHQGTRDSRLQLLHQAQADLEKSASRQWL